ncbi:MAG: Rrf2 family transcriptional regulator [Bacteroidota bacterium]|nr:Rrf2 family transcriptional regulator [Bacteroidota bacterium]
MKLSNTTEYSLRILGFMAKDSSRMYSAKYLVKALNISDKYLRRLMTNLSKAGFIESKQGRTGGYVFSRPTENIYVIEIINSIEGTDYFDQCVMGFEECSDENPCALHLKWTLVRDNMTEIFKTTSLKDMANKDIDKF